MSRNAELSTSFQDPAPGSPGSNRMTVAVIGPNAAHRRIVAKALSGSEARTVREFIDYPAKLTDIQRLMEQQRFDVVMIDVDSDQSYALEVVQKFAALENVMVMVYSKRTNDQALLRTCIEAGARDFLPLPAEGDVVPERPAAPPPTDAVRRPQPSPADLSRAASTATPDIMRTAPPVPQESPRAAAPPEPAYRAPMPSYEPERRPDAVPSRPVGPIPVPSLPSADPGMVRQPKREPIAPPPAAQIPPAAKAEPKPQQPASSAEKQSGAPVPSDFAAWDNAWIRASQSPSTGAAEVESRSIAQPAIKKPTGGRMIGGAAATQPQQKPAPRASAAVAKEEPASAPIFRGVEESSDTPSPNWKKWALIGGVPVLLIGGLTYFFMRPSHPAAPPAAQMQVVTPEADPSADATEGQSAASTPAPASSKPSPVAQNSAAKPNPTSPANQQAQAKPQAQSVKPVSPDLMTAQLSAPSKISGTMKRPGGSVEDAPPTGFTPGAIETGGSMPGGVFGSKNNVKVVAAPAGVSTISAGVADGMILHRTPPVFPQFAKQAHMSGTITLGATISANGTIEDLHVLSGPEIFRAPAMDAVKTWRYRPYKLNNTPVPVQTTIRVIFSLDQR